jgi:hypothetical protein
VNQFLFSWAKFCHWLNFILFYFFFVKKVVLPAFYHLIPLKKEFQNNFARSFVSLSSRWSNNIEAYFDYLPFTIHLQPHLAKRFVGQSPSYLYIYITTFVLKKTSVNAEGPNLGNAAEFSTNDNTNVAQRSKVPVKSYHFYLLLDTII